MGTGTKRHLRGGAKDVAAQLDQLRIAEFGNRIELTLRFSVILSSSVALYLYSGHWYGPVWGVVYTLSQIATFSLLTRSLPMRLPMPFALSVGAYILTTLIFLCMPLGLFLFGDRTLAFAGGMGLVALCVFQLWREEPPSFLLWYDILVGWFIAVCVVIDCIRYIHNPVGLGIVTVLTATAATYYSLALYNTRRAREALKVAAQRGIEAQKMEAIGRLSGGVAHDFNNLLTVLQGNLELYDEVDDPDERRGLIVEARAASERAAGLVSQLLAFARRAPLEPSVIEAKAVIEELTGMTARLLPASVTVFPAIPGKPVYARADHDQLLSSLLNLVINARDAMENRGEITISAMDVAVTSSRPVGDLRPGRYVAFAVSDTGPGMSEEVLAQAFEPFFTTKPVGAGSGLGLPTAKGFTEQSGGGIMIDTGPRGTTITLYLPRANKPVASA
ncbi:MAG: ATP-binding protein [Pseudomonadota bacterium]